VKRPSRLFLPLLLTSLAVALYALAHANPVWIARLHVAPKRFENVVLFIATLPLILFLVRALDLLAFDVFASRRTVRAPLLLRELVSIALFLILFAWAMWAIFDYKVTGFLATGTVLAAVLGLALQETLGNLFAGIALHLEDSFEVGDVIRSGDYFGVVEAVRWRGTRLRTFNNNIVIVPNSLVARDRVEVFPRQNLNARVLQVGVDSNIPPAEVIAMLTQAAEHVQGVAQELPAFARLAGFADSSLTYEIKYFMHDYSQRDRIDADIRKAVWYALRRNNVPIPYPIRAVQRYTPPAPRQHPDRDEIVDRLNRVDILGPLSIEARNAIAAVARVHVYSSGETIIRQGAAGDSMFIVHQGSVSVRAGDNEVARLKAGDFFGEMALLTGETRAADIVAVADVVAIEIAKDALQPVLMNHPDLASAITAKVMERRGSLDSARTASAEDVQQSVLSRIRAYFGL
jgi:small-conductance mechanosensitive channel/CRP-like cAMP-binding protein